MKYYCKDCGTEYSVTEETDAALEEYRKDFEGMIGGSEIKCGICGYIPNKLSCELRPLPKRETVAQWEARTGRKYPDGAPAYIFIRSINVWHLTCWGSFVEEYYGADNSIIADEAGRPPDDWRP